MSKYSRTVIVSYDGLIIPARLNTETGEIKHYKHWKRIEEETTRRGLKPLPKAVLDTSKPLFWEEIQAPSHVSIVWNSKKSKRKNKQNPNNIYLKDYLSLSEAMEEIPMIDNLCEGVSRLHSGNSRPINKGLLFNLLRDLDDINAETIQAYTGYSIKYCERLAAYLRVLSAAFDSEIDL